MISKKLLKRSSLSWYRNIYQHKARRLFCKNLSLKKKLHRFAKSKFLAKFFLIPRQTCTCLRGLSSMTFQVSDIKVVSNRLFRHLWREREKTKKMKKLLNRKTLQINLKRNDNQSGSIFVNMQCIVGSPEGKIYSRIFRIYHISLLKLLYFTDIKRRCWITERQTRKKSAQYKVKSRRHSENL